MEPVWRLAESVPLAEQFPLAESFSLSGIAEAFIFEDILGAPTYVCRRTDLTGRYTEEQRLSGKYSTDIRLQGRYTEEQRLRGDV